MATRHHALPHRIRALTVRLGLGLVGLVASVAACEPAWTSFHLDQHIEYEVEGNQRWLITPDGDGPGLVGVDCNNGCDRVREATTDVSAGKFELSDKIKLSDNESFPQWRHPLGGYIGVVEYEEERHRKDDRDDDDDDDSDDDDPEFDVVHWNTKGEIVSVLLSTDIVIHDLAIADDGTVFITGFSNAGGDDIHQWLAAYDANGTQYWSDKSKYEGYRKDPVTCKIAIHSDQSVVQACSQGDGYAQDDSYSGPQVTVRQHDWLGKTIWTRSFSDDSEYGAWMIVHDLRMDNDGHPHVLWSSELTFSGHYHPTEIRSYDTKGKNENIVDLSGLFHFADLHFCMDKSGSMAVAGRAADRGGQWTGSTQIVAIDDRDLIDWSDAFGYDVTVAGVHCGSDGPEVFGQLSRVQGTEEVNALFATSFDW